MSSGWVGYDGQYTRYGDVTAQSPFNPIGAHEDTYDGMASLYGA